MALYTGTLTDCGLGALADRELTLSFRLEQPASTSGGGLLATRPVVVTPDSQGGFSVTLVPSTSIVGGGGKYVLAASWLSDSGTYSRADFFRFTAMRGGGTITLESEGVDPNKVWVGDQPPTNLTTWRWWLDTTTGILKGWN